MIEKSKSAAFIKTDADTISFKCKACRKPMVVNSDMMGADIECLNCEENIRTPLHIFSINPFRRPIYRLVENLKSIQWKLPFFPQLIESIVLLFVMLVTIILYLTVGIASQISGMFQSLMLESRREIISGNLVEKSAYAIAGGIYFMLWLPFWLILFPFTFLGWIWKYLRYVGLIILAVLLILKLFLFFNPEVIFF